MAVASDPKAFNCATCPHRHCDNSNPSPFARWVIPGVIESKTCLLPMIAPQSEQFLRLYPFYKKGVMPFSGGVMEQPNAYLQAMEIIDRETTKANE